MKTSYIRVPAPVLLDPQLRASAKVLWMVLQLGGTGNPPFTPATLERLSGLARHTVMRGLAQLAEWKPGGGDGQASLPPDLLLDTRVSVRGKLLYGVLQLTPGFRRSAGDFTYNQLSSLAGTSTNTVKHAVADLCATGWLKILQVNRLSRIQFTLRNPATEQQQDALVKVRQRLQESSFRGEAIIREYLSLLVDSDEYDDDASPAFLVNPYTGEEMQFDRYYPHSVAFEYQGPQHDGPTERYPNSTAAIHRQARDLIKLGICMTRGITLVVLYPTDLHLAMMRQKVDGLLPLRDLKGQDRVVTYLEAVSRAYRKDARWGRPTG